MKRRATSVIFLFVASAFLFSCSKSSDEKKNITAIPAEEVTIPAVTSENRSSAEQLQSATYTSEYEKSMLAKFKTGTEFCEKFKSITSTENGFYVSVPIDYKNLSKGTTQIWAYFTSGPFNPDRPTMIFFDGGSGGNTHGSPAVLKNFNELHYDQRGIGCSSPQSLAVYRDPSFYSNENSARDANEIRKALKIEKVSLLGASYGTVVANVFANLFEQNTTALVIDGVVYSNEDTSEVVRYSLKKMYEKLPTETQEAMRSYFNDTSKITAIWSLARLLMYSNRPFDELSKLLLIAFPNASEINQEVVKKFFDPNLSENAFFNDEIGSVEAFNNSVLNCKNSKFKETIKMSLFGNIQGIPFEFHKYDYESDRTETCNAIGVFEQNEKPYIASEYPVNVPVTYFQGNEDGATFADGAIKHYKKVPKGKKQILIAVKGGHCAGYSAVKAKLAHSVSVMEKALLGEKILPSEVQKMNEEQSDVKWVTTSKNW